MKAAPIGSDGYAGDVEFVAHESKVGGILQQQAAIRGLVPKLALSRRRVSRDGDTGTRTVASERVQLDLIRK